MKVNNVLRVEKDFLKVVDAAIAGHTQVPRTKALWLIDRVLEHGITPYELEGFDGAFQAHHDRFDPLAEARLAGFIRRAPKILTPDVPSPVVKHGKVVDPGVDSEDLHTASYQPTSGAVIGPGGVKPTDPEQGNEGDCGLISSLSAVASVNPQRIADLFKVNAAGNLEVRFYERSGKKWKRVAVEIDGDLPKKDGKLVYASTATKGSNWVSLIEKAFAKQRGGYEHLYAMYPETVLEALLGHENRTIPVNLLSPEQAYQRLSTWLEKKCAIVASSSPKGQSDGKPLANIVEDHAYALLRVYEQNGVQMVELRNPWGSFEPGSDGKDDGIFSLTIPQFLANYLSIDVTPTA